MPADEEDMEKKHPVERRVLDLLLLVVRVLLLVAIFVELVFTIELLVEKIPQGPSGLTQDISNLVSGSLLALAIMDIYLSVGVYSRGDIKNLIYIIDAAVFFVIRDMVIQLFNGENSANDTIYIYHVGILGAVVIALVAARYFAIVSAQKRVDL